MKKISLMLIAVALAGACKKEGGPQQTIQAKNHLSGALTGSADTTAVLPTPNPQQVPPPHLSGTYAGMLEARNIFYNIQSPQIRTSPVELLISGSNFGSGEAKNYSSVGGGVFRFLDSFEGSADSFSALGDIYFDNTDTSLRDNTTSNPNAGLFGSYSYEIKGDSLFLTQAYREISYRYKLKKY